MEILKYQFTKELLKVGVDGNEFVDKEVVEARFCLTHLAHKVFERSYNKSLMSVLAGAVNSKKSTSDKDMNNAIMDILDNKLVLAIASSAYYKVENSAIVQNEQTASEFLDSDLAILVTNDFDFLLKLITMVTSSLPEIKNPTKKK